MGDKDTSSSYRNTSDQVNQPNQVIGEKEGEKEEAIQAQEPEKHEENEENEVIDTTNNVENDKIPPPDGGENTSPLSY
jgi:hypothetical protein